MFSESTAAPVDLTQVPLEFSDEERTIGLRGGLVKYLSRMWATWVIRHPRPGPHGI
jgi:hypothetical protein